MRLLEINLENYRNIRSANLSFSTDRILFLGKNGQGKTNLLEAIGLSSSLRSFRRSSMEGIIKEGEKECRLFFRFLGDEGDESEILLGFSISGGKRWWKWMGNRLGNWAIFLAVFLQYACRRGTSVWSVRVPAIEGNGSTLCCRPLFLVISPTCKNITGLSGSVMRS